MAECEFEPGPLWPLTLYDPSKQNQQEAPTSVAEPNSIPDSEPDTSYQETTVSDPELLPMASEPVETESGPSWLPSPVPDELCASQTTLVVQQHMEYKKMSVFKSEHWPFGNSASQKGSGA